MTCELIAFSVPEIPHMASGSWRAEYKCKTHGIDMGPFASVGCLCAIGKIEAATEEALRKISAALDRPSQITPDVASA